MKNKDVIIIGGGVIGVCCAYFLHKSGKSVCVIDRGAIGASCSYGNAGYLTPSHFIPLSAPGALLKGLKWMFNPESPFYIKPRWDKDLFKWLWVFNSHCSQKHVHAVQDTLLQMNRQSMALYREFAENKALDFPFYSNGLVQVCNTVQGLKRESQVVDSANLLGLNASILSQNELQSRFPAIELNQLGGSYYPEDGHIQPYQFVSELRRYLGKSGVEFIENTSINDWRVLGSRIDGIETDLGGFSANEFVLSAGSWSPGLAKKLKINLQVQAGKGYSVTIEKPWDIDTPFILNEAKVAVTPWQHQLRLGGTMELAGLSEGINQRRVDGIMKSIKSYIPSFDESQIDRSQVWYGYRPCSPDGVPLIGRMNPIQNLVVATGHSMMGLSLGPVSGKLVSDIICNRSSSISLTHLNPSRFD